MYFLSTRGQSPFQYGYVVWNVTETDSTHTPTGWILFKLRRRNDSTQTDSTQPLTKTDSTQTPKDAN